MKTRSAILVVVGLGAIAGGVIPAILAGLRLDAVKRSATQVATEVSLARTTKNLESIAITLRDALDRDMRSRYEMVQSWAAMPCVAQLASEASKKTTEELFECWSSSRGRAFAPDGEAKGDGDPDNDLSPEMSRLLVELAKLTPCVEISVADTRGYTISASNATSDFDQGPLDYRFIKGKGLVQGKTEFGGESWFRATARSKTGFYVGPVRWDESAKAWGVDVNVTINEASSQNYVGQLRAILDFGKISDEWLRGTGIGLHEVKLVDQVGTIIASSLSKQDKVNHADISVANQRFFERVQQRKPSGHEREAFVDENGMQVYAGFAVSNDANRHVVVVTQTKESIDTATRNNVTKFADAIVVEKRSLLRDMLLSTGLVLLLVIALASFVYERRLALPLSQLSRYLRRLAKGDVEGLQVDVSGSDEVGQLASYLKEIHQALKSFDMRLITSRKPEPLEPSKAPPR